MTWALYRFHIKLLERNQQEQQTAGDKSALSDSGCGQSKELLVVGTLSAVGTCFESETLLNTPHIMPNSEEHASEQLYDKKVIFTTRKQDPRHGGQPQNQPDRV
jgi:hypothetical protein